MDVSLSPSFSVLEVPETRLERIDRAHQVGLKNINFLLIRVQFCSFAPLFCGNQNAFCGALRLFKDTHSVFEECPRRVLGYSHVCWGYQQRVSVGSRNCSKNFLSVFPRVPACPRWIPAAFWKRVEKLFLVGSPPPNGPDRSDGAFSRQFFGARRQGEGVLQYPW